MGDCTAAERDAAHDLLKAALSPMGYHKVLEIMAADQRVADAGPDYAAGFNVYTPGGGQGMVGKTLDDFAPIGRYFVSADFVGDPNTLNISTRVNGDLRQNSNTKNFIFNVQKVAYTSTLFALEPGDIIFTGTPTGVIVGMPKDKQVWLKTGDKIEHYREMGTLTFDLT